MTPVTPDDVAEGVRTQWAAATALESLIPAARVYTGREAEGESLPYARLLILESDRELWSGSSYLQGYEVTVEAYIAADSPDPRAVRRALDAAFAGTATDPTAGLTVPNAARVVHSRGLAGGASEPTGERVGGNDVIRATGRYQVVIQGSR